MLLCLLKQKFFVVNRLQWHYEFWYIFCGALYNQWQCNKCVVLLNKVESRGRFVEHKIMIRCSFRSDWICKYHSNKFLLDKCFLAKRSGTPETLLHPSSTVVEHSTHKPKFKCSNLTAGTRWEKMQQIKIFKHSFHFFESEIKPIIFVSKLSSFFGDKINF